METTALAEGPGRGSRVLTEKHQGIIRGDGTLPYLDFGDSYTITGACQNSLSSTEKDGFLPKINGTLISLIFKSVRSCHTQAHLDYVPKSPGSS